ncbi:MAG: hypothetical protein MZU91_15050 [Desulfosudis oleivorans]|nr:hypothetical protein [Desulfosudis oleivorans]
MLSGMGELHLEIIIRPAAARVQHPTSTWENRESFTARRFRSRSRSTGASNASWARRSTSAT